MSLQHTPALPCRSGGPLAADRKIRRGTACAGAVCRGHDKAASELGQAVHSASPALVPSPINLALPRQYPLD